MIIVNESKFEKLAADGSRPLENTFVYLMSPELKLTMKDGDDEVVIGNDTLSALRPSAELLATVTGDNVSKKAKKKFAKAYAKELKQSEKEFFVYTIIRGLNEGTYIPVLVVSDEEWKTGFLQALAEYFKDTFGVKRIKLGDYLKSVKDNWKSTKGESKRNKKFKSYMQDYAKENVSLSFDGVKALDKLEGKHAITRIVLYIGQCDDLNEVKKGSVVKAIGLYENHSEKAAKRVKKAIAAADVSKKRDRWSKEDAINVAHKVYDMINDTAE
jgi:hypothetical protein